MAWSKQESSLIRSSAHTWNRTVTNLSGTCQVYGIVHKHNPFSLWLSTIFYSINESNKYKPSHKRVKKYDITIEWEAKIYTSITLKWDYKQRKVLFSMPIYVPKVLKRIGRIFSRNPEHSPAKFTPINYDSKVQYAEPEDISSIFDGKDIKKNPGHHRHLHLLWNSNRQHNISVARRLATKQSKTTSKTT